MNQPERRIDADRLTRVESDVVWIKDIMGKTADDVTDIKIMLARDKGGNAMLKYVVHGATVVLGAVAGFFSSGMRHP